MYISIYLCTYLLHVMCKLCDCKYGYIVWPQGTELQVHVTDYYADLPEVYVAKASYIKEINTTGWAYLELHTTPEFSDEKQAFAAGYLEGYMSRELVWFHWQNMLKGYCYNKTDICGLIEDFLDQNEAFILSSVIEHAQDSYWHHVKLLQLQVEGLAVGYNAATTDPSQFLTTRDIVWINILGDLDDIAIAVSSPTMAEDRLFPDHCTGLVKLLPDLSNLYTAHTTWNSYQSMLRIQKMYVLHLRTAPGSKDYMPGYKMSMSSYPGFVHSTDDFYIMSSGLVAAETTIGNSNRQLYQYIRPHGQILHYARSMVANRLATSGRQWVEIFRKYNSGTYNNQWYIVDYNQFTPRSAVANGTVRPGLLWVVEQLPQYTEAADLTKLLTEQTYFPSYNIALFPRVFALSGGTERVATFGDWFAYTTNPRGRILAKKQAKITSLVEMFKTMRYNDFKYDPLSRCEQCRPPYSGCNAIAARNDLNPANGTFPFRALGHRSHGATDTKVTSAYMRHTHQFLAVSSPTHNILRGIPPFKWSEFDLGSYICHVGHPDEWLFKPVIHDWEWD